MASDKWQVMVETPYGVLKKYIQRNSLRNFLLNSSYGLLLITFSNYSMINPFLFSDALIDPLTMHCEI